MQPDDERLLDEGAVSEITGIKIRTLRKWRLQGRGPGVRRVEGRLVRYSLRDVQDWMRGQPIVTIGGTNAAVSFSGLATDFVGLYQVNAQIPAGLTSGNQSVMIAMGSSSSNSVLVPVH